MPDGQLDVGLGAVGPVVAAVDFSGESQGAAAQAALEADLREAALLLVSVVPPGTGAGRPVPRQGGDGSVRTAGDTARADLRHLVGQLPPAPRRKVTTVAPVGAPAQVLARLSGRAELLVLGARGTGGHRLWAAGAVGRPLLRTATCPVLVAGRGRTRREERGSRLVVVAAGESDARTGVAVDVGLAQAVRRGADLLLVQPYAVRAGEDGAAALRRARGRSSAALAPWGVPAARLPGVVLTTVHTTEPPGPALVHHARAAELVVVGAGPPPADPGYAVLLDSLPCGVVVVPPGLGDRRESCRAAYRQALRGELERTVPRADGCTTVEELDDVWRVGVASPPVGDAVPLAWRLCLERSAEPLPGRSGEAGW